MVTPLDATAGRPQLKPCVLLLGQIKQADPNLKRCSLESISKQLMGSAQSIGLEVRPNSVRQHSVLLGGELDQTRGVLVLGAGRVGRRAENARLAGSVVRCKSMRAGETSETRKIASR